MTFYLLLLTLYIWPFGQLLSFSTTVFPFTIYLLDVAVFFLFVSLVLSKKRAEIFNTPITKPLLMFLGVVILSFLFNIKQGIASGLPLSFFYLFRLIIYPSLFFAISFVDKNRLIKPITISIGIFLFLSLVQYLSFPDMRFLKSLGFDDHYYRLIGSFYDPNFTGAILAGLSLYFIGKNKIIYSIPLITLLSLTFSRASYLAFAVGLIILLLTRKKIKLILLVALLGVIVYLIPKPFGEGVNLFRTFSIYSRIESWQSGLNLFIDKPILGWGYNTLRNAEGGRFQVDNSFIFLLATTGLVGFFAFMNLLIKIYRQAKDREMLLIPTTILIHSLFNNSLFFIWISAVFWFAAGLSIKAKEYKSI